MKQMQTAILVCVFLILSSFNTVGSQGFQTDKIDDSNPMTGTEAVIGGDTNHEVDDEVKVDQNEYTPHGSITISSDSDFDNYGFPGSGTAEDPYIIENYNFTVDESTDTIIYLIAGTSHYVIRNNYLWNPHDTNLLGIYTHISNGIIEDNLFVGISRGIELSDATNITIEGNTFDSTIGDTLIISFSNNILVKSNQIINSTRGIYGIYIDETDNLSLIGNTLSAIYGQDINNITIDSNMMIEGVPIRLNNINNTVISNNTMISYRSPVRIYSYPNNAENITVHRNTMVALNKSISLVMEINNSVITENNFISGIYRESERDIIFSIIGVNVTVSHNYYSHRNSPDDDNDGIVDQPYRSYDNITDNYTMAVTYPYTPSITGAEFPPDYILLNRAVEDAPPFEINAPENGYYWYIVHIDILETNNDWFIGNWTGGPLSFNLTDSGYGSLHPDARITVYIINPDGHLSMKKIYLETFYDAEAPVVEEGVEYSYTEGETGNTVEVMMTDEYPGTYNITLDGQLFRETTEWVNGTNLINVDGLDVGNHRLWLYVYDQWGFETTMRFDVTVEEYVPPGSESDTIGTVGPVGIVGTHYWIFPMIAILVILRRSRSVPRQ